MITFTILGPPRTKKNHGRLVRVRGFHKLIPSREYMDWYNSACRQAWIIKHELGRRGVVLPITGPVRVSALFYRQTNTGDANGYTQGLGDWLERVGILQNDRQIADWDGTRLLKDAARPRVEVSVHLLGGEAPAVQVAAPRQAAQEDTAQIALELFS